MTGTPVFNTIKLLDYESAFWSNADHPRHAELRKFEEGLRQLAYGETLSFHPSSLYA